MNGWIIYTDYEAKRNRWFIDHFIKTAESFEHTLTLKIPEEITAPYPDFAIVRAFDWKINKRLENAGVRVFNNSHFARHANNKELCYKYVQKNGIEIMPTYYEIPRNPTYPLIVKSAVGHGGTQVFWVNSDDELTRAVDKTACPIFQETASDIGKDLRLYVMKNEIIVGMLRQNRTDFRSNYCLGGNAKVYTLSSEEKKIAKKVISLFDIDYGGIDFVFNNGKIVFNEAEDAVGARMIYDLTDIDIVRLWFEKLM